MPKSDRRLRGSAGPDALNKIYEGQLRDVPEAFRGIFGRHHKGRRFITTSSTPHQVKASGKVANDFVKFMRKDPVCAVASAFLSIYEMLDLIAVIKKKLPIDKPASPPEGWEGDDP